MLVTFCRVLEVCVCSLSRSSVRIVMSADKTNQILSRSPYYSSWSSRANGTSTKLRCIVFFSPENPYNKKGLDSGDVHLRAINDNHRGRPEQQT